MITIILAPVFILFSIHPGKGKKIFLGWLQGFLSALMKYFAVGLLLVVMVNIYGSVFANLNGMMLLIVSMVLALVFLSYRKDIVELLGKIDLGGTQLSNALGDRLDKIKEKAKDYSTATLAGGAAGIVTGQGFAHGAVEGFTMQASRGSGLIASGVRTTRRLNNEANSIIDRAEKARVEADRNAENRNFLNNMNKDNLVNNNAYNDGANKNYLMNNLATEEKRLKESGTTTGANHMMGELKDEVNRMSPEEVKKQIQDINRRQEMIRTLDDDIKQGKGTKTFIDNRAKQAENNVNEHARTIQNTFEREKFVRENRAKLNKYKETMTNSISVDKGVIKHFDTKKIAEQEKQFDFKKSNTENKEEEA